jgi:isoquinoline 1-oxidoreductase subunit alpha
MPRVTALNVNGKRRTVDVDASVSLLGVLRDDVDLTGTKYGCGEGRCGACTVLLNGQLTRSCVTQVGRAAGKQITTIEGLEKDGKLHPLQETHPPSFTPKPSSIAYGIDIALVSSV